MIMVLRMRRLKTEKDRTEIRNILRAQNYKPTLVWVQTDFTTIKIRLKAKYKTIKKAKEIYDAAVAEMEAPADFEKLSVFSVDDLLRHFPRTYIDWTSPKPIAEAENGEICVFKARICDPLSEKRAASGILVSKTRIYDGSAYAVLTLFNHVLVGR